MKNCYDYFKDLADVGLQKPRPPVQQRIDDMFRIQAACYSVSFLMKDLRPLKDWTSGKVSGMLFAPAELDLYGWFQIVSQRFWDERGLLSL